MKCTSINNISYLNTWINTIENDVNTSNLKNHTTWENVIAFRYPEIDNTLYIYLQSKLENLKIEFENNFQIALLCSIRNLARIIKQTNDVELKLTHANKFSDKTKKMHSLLNIYTTLAQGPFFDELDILNSLISILEKKDYTKKTLTPAIEFLSSKKHDFSKFSLLADSDIRNAKDHNDVSYNNYNFVFKYKVGKQSTCKTVDHSTFINNFRNLLQGIKTFIRVIIEIISNEKINNDDLINYIVPEKKFDWFSLLLTTYKISCEQFESYPIIDNRTQIALSFNGLDVNEDNRLWFLVKSAVMAALFIDNEGLNFDRIFINFKSPRTITSFIALPAKKISQYLKKEISFDTLLKHVDGCLWPINHDTQPLQDINYHDIDLANYSIREIEDISSEDKKVLKAIIIAPNITTVEQVKVMAKDAVDLLKKQPNGGKQSFKTKHGSFLADRIYCVVYKSEKGNRSLFEDNSNFITTIQFDKNNFFEINSTNPLLSPLKSEIQENMEFRWNPNFAAEI